MVPKAAGGLLLTAALIVLLAGHALIRPPTTGFPLPMTIAGPPRIGDCVLSAPDPVVDPDVISLPVTFGPCSGVVAGEIVSVVAGRPAAQDGAIGALMGTAGPCWEAASRYAGLATSGGVAALPSRDSADSAPGAPRWLPTLRVRGQRVTADALQRAGGRDWSGCMVRPDDLSVYLGSVRDAVAAGAAPAPYGDCAPAAKFSAGASVRCSRPHARERLGWAAVPTGAQTSAALARSCRELAARLLRTPDPTYSGILEIVVSAGDVTDCSLAVRGPGRLSSSLIGIAGAPLPLTT
jgi:hypothetical protein